MNIRIHWLPLLALILCGFGLLALTSAKPKAAAKPESQRGFTPPPARTKTTRLDPVKADARPNPFRTRAEMNAEVVDKIGAARERILGGTHA